MLAYAATRRRAAERRSSPSTMLFVIGAHVAAVALAMSAKYAIDRAQSAPPTVIIPIPLPKDPPPPVPTKPTIDAQIPDSKPFVPPVAVPTPPQPSPDFGTTGEPAAPSGPTIGNDRPTIPPPFIPTPPVVDPVRLGPRLATPPSALRPPYPPSKLDTGEEAALRLRLSIDDRGRVTAVEPVGRADPSFLAVARRHLIAKWRYQPATVDGRAVSSTTVITLRFELDG